MFWHGEAILLAVFLELVGEPLAELGAEAFELLELGRVLECDRACFQRVVGMLVRGDTFGVFLSGRIPPFLDPLEEQRIGTLRHGRRQSTRRETRRTGPIGGGRGVCVREGG